jgi:ubiquinone/menaquinone biosynthesis C-methylase UbiE
MKETSWDNSGAEVSTKAPYSPWESAYRSFETPEEETRKFIRRLLELGAKGWPRDAAIVELFCGHGNGLHALTSLGFSHLEGVDLSAELLAEYTGPAKCYVADCRSLPLPGNSRNIAVINGGLHHLPKLPEDLEQTLSEVHRVLREGGQLVIVEPWLTPFLSIVHQVCKVALARRLSKKIRALATMIVLEQPVYGCWLDQPKEILGVINRFFEPQKCKVAWGKLLFVGSARSHPL